MSVGSTSTAWHRGDSAPRWVLRGHGRATGVLAATALGAGVAEAMFLVVISRAALGVTRADAGITLPLVESVTPRGAAVVAVALIAVRTGLGLLSGTLSARITADLMASQRDTLLDAYLTAPWPVQAADPPGRLQELLTTHVTAAGTVVTSVANIITAGLNTAALIAFAVLIDPLQALGVIVVLAALGAVLGPLRMRVRRRAQRSVAAGTALATELSETARIGLELRAFGVEPELQARLHRTTVTNRDAARRVGSLRAMVPVAYTSTAYLVLAGMLVLAASTTTSAVDTAGPILLILLRSLSYGQSAQSSRAQLVGNSAFVEALRVASDHYRSTHLPDGAVTELTLAPVCFTAVAYSYGDGADVLHDLSFTIEPGEIVGIVGPSGGGKSTLVQLLLGLRRPSRGTYRYGATEQGSYLRAAWHRHVALVPQVPQLVRGTVADNIRFLRHELSDAEVVAAATRAQLHDEIMRHPAGYDRLLGEDGDALSGGQAQRLCLARALAGRPAVLVLDEPTSALDVRSELLIRETLAELRGRTTVIIVAHRMSTLDICDRIMVIDGGRLNAFDSPAALRQRSQFYRHSLELSVEPGA
jgi:ABC-type multidrug transport system fused ATPase/permease subunit